MIAMTMPAEEALPVTSVTKGGISSETNAEYAAPMANIVSIHHSKALALVVRPVEVVIRSIPSPRLRT
jgi:hypothetical protein